MPYGAKRTAEWRCSFNPCGIPEILQDWCEPYGACVASRKVDVSLTGLKQLGAQPYGVCGVWFSLTGLKNVCTGLMGLVRFGVRQPYGVVRCMESSCFTEQKKLSAVGPGRKTYGPSETCLDLKNAAMEKNSCDLVTGWCCVGSCCLRGRLRLYRCVLRRERYQHRLCGHSASASAPSSACLQAKSRPFWKKRCEP